MFNVKKELNLQNIYLKISEEDILNQILPETKTGRFFSIRGEKNKSACISKYNGKLYIKDFGDPLQPKAETWYQYIGRQNNWNTNTIEGYLQVLNWANIKFNCNLEEPDFTSIDNSKKFLPSNTKPIIYSTQEAKKDVKLEIKRRKWEQRDLDYWNQFGLTKEWLISKKIFPLECYWLTNPNTDNIRRKFNTSNKLTYVYPYYRKKVTKTFMYKIYSPLETSFKWLSNIDSSVVENARFIKKPRENCIIQSSLKDVGVMEYFRDTYGIFRDYDFN